MKLKKLLIDTMLATAFMLSVLALTGQEIFNVGVETAYAEISGDWEYSITDSEAKTASITGYSGSKANVTIPSEIDGYDITSIGNNAFEYCITIKNVVIPEGVTTIGQYAFRECSNMYSVSIPESMVNIDSRAFYACSGLESIYIPAGVASIGELAFQSCGGLNSIVVAEENSVYDSRNNCNAIIETSTNTLLLGGNITIIPNSITKLEAYSFDSCSTLESIVIPDTVTTIGDSAFYRCKNLTSVTIPNTLTSIGSCMFTGCSSLTSVTIPDGVTSIGSSAFSGCTSLANVEIKGELTEIKNSAFYNCSSLTSITIPSSVTKIDYSVFSGCTGLTAITIPMSVNEIGSGAFRNCSGLKSIVVEDGNAIYDSRDNCNAIIETETNKLLYGCKNTVIPDTVTSVYDYAFRGSDITSITIPSGITSIGQNAFQSCESLVSVNISEGITNIGNGAFYDCSSLTSITIPASVTSIGSSAFQRCGSLTSIVVADGNAVYDSRDNCNAVIKTSTNELLYGCNNTVIPAGVATIASNAFYNCSGLTSITIPSSVTSIAYNSFMGCSGVTSIIVDSENTVYDSRDNCNAIITTSTNELLRGCNNTEIPGTAVSIGKYAFNKCDKLTSIVIPTNIMSIGENAFDECSGLVDIAISSGVTSIGGYAFDDCISLTSIHIPSSVTSIGNSAFRGCSNVTSITVDSANTVYDSRNNCNAMINTETNELMFGCKNTVIPSTVISIGEYAFYNCTGITSIIIPEGVATIGMKGFDGCTNLTSINMPSSITSIGSSAFYRCDNMVINCVPDSYAYSYAYVNEISYKYIIDAAKVTLDYSTYTYDGSEKTPSVVVVSGDTTFVEGTDYEVAYSNNINVGIAIVTITAKGNCVGEINTTFEIEAAQLTDATLSATTYTYDGKAKTPSVVVKSGEVTLTGGTDYEVRYSNNVNAGTATVTVTGLGNYAGTITKTFTIAKASSKPDTVTKPTVTKPTKVTGLKQLTSYAMKYIKLSWTKVSGANGYEVYRATSKNGTYKLVKTTTKTSFKNANLKAGKNYFYKVRAYKVVDGKKVYGEFSSSKKMITKTNAPSIKVKKTTKTKAKLTWKKVTGANGYEVYMKTGAKGKYKKVTTLSAKKVTYTKAKLKSGKKYSFKVRAYRKVGNKKVYSAWSKVKSV